MWGNNKTHLLCLVQILPAALFVCKTDMSHPFLDANIPDLVKQLTTDEKISLLGAPNWWNTNAIPRLGVPAVRMSDGPNVRPLKRLSEARHPHHSEALGCPRIFSLRVYTCTMFTGSFICVVHLLTHLLSPIPVCNIPGIDFRHRACPRGRSVPCRRSQDQIICDPAGTYLQYPTESCRWSCL